MIGVALKGLLGRKLRTALTAFAIVLGVAMISGSLIFADTIEKSFNGVYDESYRAADAVITSKDATKTRDGTAEAPAFSADVLHEVASLPGSGIAEGSIEDKARLVDKRGNPVGTADDGLAVGIDTSTSQSLNPLQLVNGQWPRGDREVAIDKSTAKQQHLAVGDPIGVFADGPVHQYRVAGIVRFGTAGSIGSTTITVFDLPTAERLFGKQDKLDVIRVGAKPGVTDAELIHQIRPLLTKTTQVRSATAQAASDSRESQSSINAFEYLLLGIGGIALFVGSFVIANTLAITVSQRIRELATLRTLGASRRQVLGSLVLESAVIGLAGSAIGLFIGLGIAIGLIALLGATGVDLPSGGLVFSTRTIVVSLCAGSLVALLASLRPAIRATRIEPIAAVREGAVLPKSRLAQHAPAASAIAITCAIALFSYGALAGGLELKLRLLSLVAGVLLLFVGVTIVASRLVRPFAFVLGSPGARFGGTAGKLARRNAVRNPARTASTAAAVMIGIALITFVAVLGHGLRTSFTGAVNELFIADYAVTAGGNPLTKKAAPAVAATPGVEVVSEIRDAEATLGGSSIHVNGVDRNLTRVVHMKWFEGDDAVPGRLGRDGAFIKKRYADDHSLTLGSRLLVKTPTGTTLRLHVEGIFDEPKGGSPFADVAISIATFDRSFATHRNTYTLLNVRGGPAPRQTAQLERALRAFPDAEVETREEFKSGQLAGLTTTLNMLYALLGLSVIVSLFGVINTLVLTVFERTRELGMLRAIGMTRRQVRRMVRHESIVTALIGAALGIAVGMFLAGITARALSDDGIVFAIPYGTLVAFVGVAIVAGMLAAILPARRASKLNILEALKYE